MRRPLLVLLAASATVAGAQQPIGSAYTAASRAMRSEGTVRPHAMAFGAIVHWNTLAAPAGATRFLGAGRP